MRLELVLGDITEQRVDAIVNAANSSLLGGGGIDGATHRRGGPTVLAACRDLRSTTHPAGLAPGQAVATPAGDLAADWIIHTVGPVYSRSEDRSKVLRSCYVESLRVAEHLGVASIAFPLISAGAFGWPTEDAVRQATDTLRSAPGDGVARLVIWQPSTLELARTIAG